MTKEAIIEAYKLGRELAAEEFNQGVKMAGDELSAREMIGAALYPQMAGALEKERGLPISGRGIGIATGVGATGGALIGGGYGAAIQKLLRLSRGRKGGGAKGALLGALLGSIAGAGSGAAGYGLGRLLTRPKEGR